METFPEKTEFEHIISILNYAVFIGHSFVTRSPSYYISGALITIQFL